MEQRKIVDELCKSADENGLIETLYAVYGKNINVRIPFSTVDCNTSIDDLDFSVRASNALKRSGLMTVGDVIDAIEAEYLMQIRNLGRKSYSEIKTRILVFGYGHLSSREKTEFWRNIVQNNI